MAFISNRPSFLYLGLKRKVWTEIRGTFESLPRIWPKTYQFLGVQHGRGGEREREVDKTACGHSRSIGGDRCSCQSFVANHRQNDVDRCGAKSLRFRSEFSGNDSRYTRAAERRSTRCRSLNFIC